MFRADISAVVLFMVATPASAQIVSAQIDYPLAELKAGIEGMVGFEVGLTKDGRVTRCKVMQSSGNTDLDNQTCIQLRKTGQFKPGLDAAGRPIESTYASKLRWVIPHPPATAPR